MPEFKENVKKYQNSLIKNFKKLMKYSGYFRKKFKKFRRMLEILSHKIKDEVEKCHNVENFLNNLEKSQKLSQLRHY